MVSSVHNYNHVIPKQHTSEFKPFFFYDDIFRPRTKPRPYMYTKYPISQD
jgi:hypothetical protein